MSRQSQPTGRKQVAPANPARLNDDGVKLLNRGAAAQALELFIRARRQSPDNRDYLINAARAHAALGAADKATALLQRAAALAPMVADLYSLLGNVQEAGTSCVAALASYRRAVTLDPRHPTAGRSLEQTIAKLSRVVHGWHMPMLADELRNDAYQQAIEAAVRPDDVVLDIGAGSGLLAMMAARAGARRVYGCEMLPDLAALANIIIAKNGYADRVTVAARHSTNLAVGRDLPEPATLLISETFDSLIIGEGFLTALRHAHEHLLAPGARVIPAGASLRGQLINLPRLKALHPLKTVSGFDLSPFSIGSPVEQFYPVTPEHEDYAPLSDRVALLDFDFHQAPALRKAWSTELTATADGVVQAMLITFDLQLDANTVISTDQFGKIKHWNPVVFVFAQERAVRRGDRLTINGRYEDERFKSFTFS